MLALRDLAQNRLQLICDTALLIGVLVPLMVLLGAKTGVQQALVADLYSDPAILEINTRGNKSMGFAERDAVLAWPEASYAALKTRSYTDFVRVRKEDGDRIETARLVATEAGDPLLPAGAELASREFAVSDDLKVALGLVPGDRLDIVSDSEDRTTQPLRIDGVVALVTAPDRVSDLVIFAGYETLQLFEAFYEGYALPEFGVTDGREISTRVEDFEGMRIYADDLASVSALAQRVEAFLGVQTRSAEARIDATLRLGENLDLAFRIIAAVAIAGLAAALVSSFWAAVDRKRKTLATLALLGVPSRELACFPLIQAGCVGGASLVLAFIFFGGASSVAEALFSGRLEGGARVIAMPLASALGLIAGTLALVLGAALVSSRRILRIDPAIVLRDAP